MRVVMQILKDGSGRVCIHWFQRCVDGPINTHCRTVLTEMGPLALGGAVGRIVCQPERTTVRPVNEGGGVRVFTHSDDPRAVTCPQCMATPAYREAMAELEELYTALPEGVK